MSKQELSSRDAAERRRDEVLVMVLHLREDEGMPFSRVALHVGLTRNAAIGAYRRLRLAYDGRCECVKPENKDVCGGPVVVEKAPSPRKQKPRSPNRQKLRISRSRRTGAWQ
jgi:hypothetical protein